MWYKLGQFILKNRVVLLIMLFLATGFMAWQASKVQLSYEFSKAMPSNNEKYQQYIAFKHQFGEDGNALVIGVQTKSFYDLQHFNQYKKMLFDIKKVKGAEGIMAVPLAINLIKNDSTQKLLPIQLFLGNIKKQGELDTAKATFNNLLFYKKLLYNPNTNAYLAAVTLNKDLMASADRSRIVKEIIAVVANYEKSTGEAVYLSGLPLIRTQVADRLKKEMGQFLLGGLLLATIVLLLFFRSISSTVMSLVVVIIGVIWSFGTMELIGYKITALTALIGPLIIVIGIPNCIYFLNKYHAVWKTIPKTAETTVDEAVNNANNQLSPHPSLFRIPDLQFSKQEALLQMVSKMGIVTLFCNIAAAIGFAVFALTSSALLKEFGVVAGINIMALFFISLVFIPSVLSFLPTPKPRHVRYLDNQLLENLLLKIEGWVLHKKAGVYGLTALILVISIMGIFRLQTVGFIVDDLPKKDKIYTDLKWFEKNFGGVMPLEILVDTKKKNGMIRDLKTIQKIDELSDYIIAQPECAKPLSLVEGLKFVKQAYYDGDSLSYAVPNEFDMAFLAPYMKSKANAAGSENTFSKLLKSYIDSNKQVARVTVNMADIGTKRLPIFLDSLRHKTNQIFDSSHYKIVFTGGTITYLEGSKYIINGLRDSILWAFLLIAVCMLYLFRSVRILICSLIPNLIPLVCTAGLMGWVGVPLKPSTVLVFSVALGIAIDVTIRFLVNFKQELPVKNGDVLATAISTIHHTGISIIYTSLVLVAGFIIFCFSSFGGTVALGWLTSFTLLMATLTNLVLLPVLLLGVMKKK